MLQLTLTAYAQNLSLPPPLRQKQKNSVKDIWRGKENLTWATGNYEKLASLGFIKNLSIYD